MAKPKKEPKYMFYHSYGLFCPHCSEEQIDLQRMIVINRPRIDKTAGFTEVKCQKCGEKFIFNYQTEITFNSRALL